MTKRYLALILALLMIFPLVAVSDESNEFKKLNMQKEVIYDSNLEFAPDQVLIKMKKQEVQLFSSGGADEYGGLDIAEVISLDPKSASGMSFFSQSESAYRMLRLNISGKDNVIKAVEILNALPNIEYAEPDYKVFARAFPNDPSIGYDMTKISAQTAWNQNLD